MIKGSVFGDNKDVDTLAKSSYSMKPVDYFLVWSVLFQMRIRFLVLCTVFFVISVLLLFVITRETENEALKIPERASLNGK